MPDFHEILNEWAHGANAKKGVSMSLVKVIRPSMSTSNAAGNKPVELDTDGNGLVDQGKRYRLFSDEGTSVLLKDWRGRHYSDASTPSWNAMMAITQEDGFKVLCEGEGT